MMWMEIILLVIGIGAFAASFLVPASGEQLSREERRHTDEEIKARVDKQMEEAASKLNHSVDDAVQYAVEKTERSLERISNEKIMAVNEYADTVLSDIHKNHEEVVFLYDMLNDKQVALKNTVVEIEKTAKSAATLAKEAKSAADEAAQNAQEAALSADEAAQNAAQAAQNADEASQTALEASQNADEAALSAEEAMRRAQEATRSADTAIQTAGEAAQRADVAKQTAGAASQAANEAILSADTARQTAGDAMKSAKEIQKLSGTMKPAAARKRTMAMESQNLSGLARMQGIREAENEALEEAAQQSEAAEQLEAAGQFEAVKQQPEPGRSLSVVDISQRTEPDEPEGFRPFVIQQAAVIGESADEELLKESPKTTRTRSAAGNRRSIGRRTSVSGRTQTETALQRDDGFGVRPNASEERNNNEKILAMHGEGKSNIAIAKELGIGVGEVKLVIDLFRP